MLRGKLSTRATVVGLLCAAYNLAWAVFLVLATRNGTLSPGLVFLVPIPTVVGLYLCREIVRRSRWERA